MNLTNFILFLLYLPKLSYGTANLTLWEKHRRFKRYLIWTDQGTIRLSLGVSTAVRLYDRVPYRQLRIQYNLSAAYSLPTTAAMLRSSWIGRKLETMKYEYENIKLNEKDQLRTVLYTMIEVELNRNGQNGRECLKRAICENGQYAENDGLFAEIIHEFLRPSKFNPDKEYVNAYNAGKYGADCLSSFEDCKRGDSFLDNFIFIKEQ